MTDPLPLPLASAAELLPVLLDLSPAGIVCYSPLTDEGGELVDFTFAYLNPAAQRLLALPSSPGTYLERFPLSRTNGAFAFHRDTFLSGEPRQFSQTYSAADFDHSFQAAAQRVGQHLLVTFTLLAEQPRPEIASAGRERPVDRPADHQRLLQERETLYQVFAQTPALIALLRAPGHRFDYVNPAFQQLFPGRELVGRDYVQALPEAQAQGFVDLLDHVYRTGETYYGHELPFIVESPTHPAHPRYYNFTYQAYREDGQIAGISSFAFDVTEQVLARAQRVAEQQQSYNLFLQAPAPIAILDGPNLVYQLVNPAYQRIFPGRELLSKPLLEALPELVDSPIPGLLRHVYETGETYVAQEMRLMMARHEGEPLRELYCTFTYQARRNAAGAVNGVLVFVYDITEQVLARRVVEESAQRLQLLTDALPVLISYIDHSQTYRFANRAYEAWFQHSPAAVIGKHPREVVGEVAYQEVRGYIERALAGERVEYDACMVYRDDFIRHTHGTFVPDVQDGRVMGFYTLVADVTAQVEARQAVEVSAEQARSLATQLATTNEQLVRTNADLDNFIYTASHDLKAPIANIEGLLHAVQQELPADCQAGEVPVMLQLMQESVERFGRTIRHLTDLSRLQKEYEQVVSQVSLARVIAEVLLDMAPLVTQTNALIKVSVPEATTVTYSEKNLRSVIYNLLSNALKYRHPDRQPHIQLLYQVQESFHVLAVQDNGLGLDVALAGPKLFGMFQRLHSHVEGTGVGLHMVKRMVENAGGRIEVESEPEQGTTFRVYLPR